MSQCDIGFDRGPCLDRLAINLIKLAAQCLREKLDRGRLRRIRGWSIVPEEKAAGCRIAQQQVPVIIGKQHRIIRGFH